MKEMRRRCNIDLVASVVMTNATAFAFVPGALPPLTRPAIPPALPCSSAMSALREVLAVLSRSNKALADFALILFI